jgi:hypothetical protein
MQNGAKNAKNAKETSMHFRLWQHWLQTKKKQNKGPINTSERPLTFECKRNNATLTPDTIFVLNRVARWFVFQPKIPNWENNSRVSDWKMLIYFMDMWNNLWTFGIFHEHSAHCVFIWYIFPVLVSCTKKNLATLVLNATK